MVRYEVQGPTAIATIDRAEVRNALDRPTLRSLRDAYERFEADPGARVLVVTGAGDKAFSAGADLKAIAAGWVPTLDEWPVPGRNIDVRKPVIAAVNGAAIGGGFNVVLSCDLVVAAEHATFTIPEARLGRNMDWAALLPRTIPSRIVMEMMLTGRGIDAQRAQAVGLVNVVVPADELLSTAISLADEIAGNSQASVLAAKAMVHRAIADDATALAADATEIFAAVHGSAEADEAARAFVARRSPAPEGDEPSGG